MARAAGGGGGNLPKLDGVRPGSSGPLMMPTSGRDSNRRSGAITAVFFAGSGVERTIAIAPTVTAAPSTVTPVMAPITGQSMVLTNPLIQTFYRNHAFLSQALPPVKAVRAPPPHRRTSDSNLAAADAAAVTSR